MSNINAIDDSTSYNAIDLVNMMFNFDEQSDDEADHYVNDYEIRLMICQDYVDEFADTIVNNDYECSNDITNNVCKRLFECTLPNKELEKAFINAGIKTNEILSISLLLSGDYASSLKTMNHSKYNIVDIHKHLMKLPNDKINDLIIECMRVIEDGMFIASKHLNFMVHISVMTMNVELMRLLTTKRSSYNELQNYMPRMLKAEFMRSLGITKLMHTSGMLNYYYSGYTTTTLISDDYTQSLKYLLDNNVLSIPITRYIMNNGHTSIALMRVIYDHDPQLYHLSIIIRAFDPILIRHHFGDLILKNEHELVKLGVNIKYYIDRIQLLSNTMIRMQKNRTFTDIVIN